MRPFYVTRTVLVTSVLLLSYFLLPATQILDVAENIQFSDRNIPVDTDPERSTSPRIAAEVPTRIRGFERNEE